jgi:hypothetical protein
MRTVADVANVTELFRRNNERAVCTASQSYTGAIASFFLLEADFNRRWRPLAVLFWLT